MHPTTALALILLLAPSAFAQSRIIGDPGPSAIRPEPRPASAPLTEEQLVQLEEAFIARMNRARQDGHLVPLKFNEALARAAAWMCRDLMPLPDIAHRDSLGRTSAERIRIFGYGPARVTAENISGGDGEVEAAFQGYWNACDAPTPGGECTYGHRKNIMQPLLREVGTVFCFDPNSRYGAYNVTDFGAVFP